jgi:hypothetical protein
MPVCCLQGHPAYGPGRIVGFEAYYDEDDRYAGGA